MNSFSKIYIATDHRGFYFKGDLISSLKQHGYQVIDLGPKSLNLTDDYIDYAIKVCKEVQRDRYARGVLLCGSGIGMSIVANKFKGIRASRCLSNDEAKRDRLEHDSNILILGEKQFENETYKEILNGWVNTEFDPEETKRYTRRIKKINNLDAESITYYRDKAKVVPAILSTQINDYKELSTKYSQFTNNIHIDLMDISFTQNISPDVNNVINAISKSDVLMSYHLMLSNPMEYLGAIERVENIIQVAVHLENLPIEEWSKEYAFELVAAINPNTHIEKYREIILNSSRVQIMCIVPGEQGRAFIPETLYTINLLRKWGYDGAIELDGGINIDTLKYLDGYDIDVVNIGSAIQFSEDYEQEFNNLNRELTG